METPTIHTTENRSRVRPARWSGLVAFAAAAAVLVTSVGAEQTPPRDMTSSTGGDLFKVYCASCHGLDAMGHGLMTSALRHAPADLTVLSANNGGVFPAARVKRIIEGRDVESHGDRDMPVWGDPFKATPGGRSPEVADARITAIVLYLEGIQRRAAH